MQHDSGKRTTEENMIALLQKNDLSSFDKLYEYYAPLLFGIIVRFPEAKENAESVLQKCFKHIWENRNLFNASKESLYTWMYKITKNTALPLRRATISPEIEINQDTTENLAFTLVVTNGYSYQETASLLNISIEVLKSKIKAALQKAKPTAAS